MKEWVAKYHDTHVLLSVVIVTGQIVIYVFTKLHINFMYNYMHAYNILWISSLNSVKPTRAHFVLWVHMELEPCRVWH